MEKLKLEKRKLIHEGTVLRFYEDKMILPDGSKESWDIIEHKFNASAVLPILPDGKVLLVSQYRSTVDRMTWEIPAGKNDEGAEDPAICAKRELEEETGYSTDKLNHLFTYSCAIAYSTELVEIYQADNVVKVGEQHLDPSEFINIRAWDLKEIIKNIYDGKIVDGKTIAAVMAYAASKAFGQGV